MTKTVEAPTTYSSPQAYLEATYPGIEIVDAVKPLNITVTDADRKASNRKDPRSCALAVACNRQEEVTDAIVTRAFAYVVYPRKRGRKMGWRAVRHFVTGRSRRALLDFDQTGEFPAGEFTFSAVPPTQRLNNNRPKGPLTKTQGPRSHRRLPGIRTAITA